jgi:regulator of cell morphogenesis and NO signaling
MGEPFEQTRVGGAAAVDEEAAAGWPVDRLIDHIVATHHAYTRSALLAVARHLAKLVSTHGSRHPELARIGFTWDRLAGDLIQHMMKEERILFPYIRELAGGARRPSPFGTVENPIRMMEREHQAAADALRTIRELSKGFVTPPDGGAVYRLCFEELTRFERDLQRHIHLEDNVLFPKAVTLERRA